MSTTTKTQWLHAQHTSVHGAAAPRVFTDETGETNTVAAIRISRASGVGAIVIEGPPEDLVVVATRFLEVAVQLVTHTAHDPALRTIYGRV